MAEMGIVGLLSFGWILYTLYRTFFKFHKFIKDSFVSALSIGVLAGLTGFIIQITFDTFLYSVQLGSLFWVQMALLMCLLQCETRGSELAAI